MLLTTFKVQYQRARSEYEAKVYEQDSIARSLEAVTAKLTDITSAAGSSTSYKSSEVYKNLVAYQNVYDTKKAQLDTEIKVLDEQMKSYKEAMKKGIKDNTSWSCFA